VQLARLARTLAGSRLRCGNRFRGTQRDRRLDQPADVARVRSAVQAADGGACREQAGHRPRVRQLQPTTQLKFTGSPVRRRRRRGGHVFRFEMSNPLAPHSDERRRCQLIHRFPRLFDGRIVALNSPPTVQLAPRPRSQRSHCLCTAGAPRVRAIGNVCPLRMNGVYALVIGSADERLQRLPEVYRMLSSYVQIEGSVRVVAFDQLEMVGDVVP